MPRTFIKSNPNGTSSFARVNNSSTDSVNVDDKIENLIDSINSSNGDLNSIMNSITEFTSSVRAEVKVSSLLKNGYVEVIEEKKSTKSSKRGRKPKGTKLANTTDEYEADLNHEYEADNDNDLYEADLADGEDDED